MKVAHVIFNGVQNIKNHGKFDKNVYLASPLKKAEL